MNKAIFYKEWIKTRWMLLLSLLVLVGFSTYLLLNLYRVLDLKGAVHIWEVMIQRDALFVELLKYLPLLIGIILGVTQYVPEMHQKCLKLTLHLPYDSTRMIASMLGFGILSLLVLSTISLGILFVGLNGALPIELTRHILLSAVVWYIAGIAGYLFTAWITLEPTWKRRILNGIVSILVLKIFFTEAAGEAFNDFLPILIIGTLLFTTFTFLSVSRFKEGKQD
ncbi:MAG: hypothetical protein RR202_11005 [Bacteroidales bacterium]